MLNIRKFSSNRDVVVFGRLLTSYGYYLVVPFLAVYLTKYSDVTIVQAGILLAIFNFGRRGFGLAAGYLSDHYGSKAVMLVGIVFEMIAYILYTISGNFAFFAVVVTLSGVGGCLYNIASRSVLANDKEKENIAESFSLYYIIMHVGAILGPITYMWLSGKGNMRATFLIAAVSYLVFFIVSAFALKNNGENSTDRVVWKDVATALTNKRFLIFCMILTCIWFIVTQLYCGIPLLAVYKNMPSNVVANLNLINAIIVVCLLFPFGKYLDRINSLKKFNLLIIGTLIMSLGWLICAVPVNSGWGIFAAVIIFTIGEIMFISVADVLANTFAPNGQSGIYLGIAAVTWGIGGSIGSYLGGTGFNFLMNINIDYFWWIIALVGFCTCLFALSARSWLFEEESIAHTVKYKDKQLPVK